jgi:hypothetical protein
MIRNQIHCIKKNNCLLLVLSLFLIGCTTTTEENSITISNSIPRLDEEGQIVDAHDGRVIQFGDRYYWYGTAYANTNGFVPSNHYRCYSSDDLTNWTYEGRLLPDQPEGVYYRPHVIYNEPTQKYVLWYNWYPQLWDGQFGVAVSDTPEGPFEIVHDNVPMANSEYGLGDFGLYVDDDGTGYISYNTIRDHMVSIEQLNDDFLSSTMENGGVIAKHVEAGSQFKRNGKYYLLTDYTCCFCNYGSGARVYMSDDPLSGYQLTGNINRYPGRVADELTDGQKVGTHYATLEKKKNGFHSIDISLPETTEITKLEVHLFTGNRPANCGDVANPRVHPKFLTPSFKIEKWAAGEWVAATSEVPDVARSALSEKLTISFRAEAGRIRITPDSTSTPFEAVYVNEVVLTNDQDQPINIQEAYVTGQDIQRPPIVPAQQTYVMELQTSEGTEFIWMGDLWGSASDNRKGHDYQYWSAPLEFNSDGTIQRMNWKNEWSFKKKQS